MKKTVRDVEWQGRTAVCRCDFNVPLDGSAITDDTRIRASLPTIQYLLEHGAKVVLMSHLGRPKGEPKPELTLAPVAERLSQLLGKDVKFLKSEQVVDDEVRRGVEALEPGQVALLENVRYRKEEEKNDPEFAK